MVNHLDDDAVTRLADVLESRSHGRKRSAIPSWLSHVVTIMVAVIVAWVAMQVRVSVLETRVNNMDDMLKEMRADIKVLLARER